MSQSRKARGGVGRGPKEGLRATGQFDWHPDDCGCRKCRRMRAAVARRSTPGKDALGRELGTPARNQEGRTNMTDTKQARYCFWINPTQQPGDKGWIPSRVDENSPGHAPLTGNGPFAEPWYWGRTYEEAVKVCEEENAKLGLSEDDVFKIMASSMAAQSNEVPCGPECDHPEGETAGHPFPDRPGYVTGECGHAVAGSEWRAGYRNCERCGG